MADPLSDLLQKKKDNEIESPGSSSKPVRGLFDFDVEATLGKNIAAANTAAHGGYANATTAGGVTVGERIFQALSASSTVDFPMVTEICDRVAKEPREVPEAVRLLVGGFSDPKGPPRRALKALTIMNELIYDQSAVVELREVHGVRDALWRLQLTSSTGLGADAEGQIRMFATEIEKRCFGSAGDPFAPLTTVPDDPFTLNTVPLPQPQTRQPKESSSVMGTLWQMGSAGLAAAQEVANSGIGQAAQGSVSALLQGGPQSSKRSEVPRLAVHPGATRPVLDVQFDGLLRGEKVHHVVGQAYFLLLKPFKEVQGRLLITNYRLKFQVPKGTFKDELAWIAEKQHLDIPLGAVEGVRTEGQTSEAGAAEWKLYIDTKDFRCIMLLLPSAQDLALVEEAVASMSQPGSEHTQVLFAFQHADASWAAGVDRGLHAEAWKIYDAKDEYARMGTSEPSSPWAVSDLNRSYGLCSTYPSCLVQPRSVSEADLRSVASFRKRGRIPTMSWTAGPALDFASLWRCSQPTEGLMGNNCNADEKMLQAIRSGSPRGRDRELLVVDLRPRKAAYANKVGGGGFESYTGCRLIFGGIDNVHGVRDGWRKMGQAVNSLSSNEVGSWFKDIANSGWYDILGAVIYCACQIIEELDTHRCNALIHCSDGWDRTAQVSSVVMLCMDPYYRTIRGLTVLIQKEFCSFGHRFRTRLANGEKATSEYSPIFLQWLECVYQLTFQFPTAFEFTPELLLLLAKEVVSNRYGTFLVDCEKERAEKVASRTLSLWFEILNAGPTGPAPEHVNPRYARVEATLRPSPSQANFQLWEEYWFRYQVHPRVEHRRQNGL